jgi:hypothetical protein
MRFYCFRTMTRRLIFVAALLLPMRPCGFEKSLLQGKKLCADRTNIFIARHFDEAAHALTLERKTGGMRRPVKSS